MSVIAFLFKLAVGAVFGLGSALALSPLSAAFVGESDVTNWMLLITFVIPFIFILFAPTVRRSFGRGFLFLGAAVFALPLSTLVLSGSVVVDTVAAASEVEKDYAVVGGVVAGGMMTVAASFIGFILGTILLIVGLILSLGGRREVVVVRR